MKWFSQNFPIGIWEKTDGLANTFRFGCYQFKCLWDYTECCLDGYPLEKKSAQTYANCDNRDIIFVSDGNTDIFPKIRTEKYDLKEGYCPWESTLESKTFKMKGIIIAGSRCISELKFQMKNDLSCLQDTLYYQTWEWNLQVEAELISLDIDGDEFEIEFCAQPYSCDNTVKSIDDFEVFDSEWCFEVRNDYAKTYPNMIITVKWDTGENMTITYGDTEIIIEEVFNIGDIIYLDWESWQVTVNDQKVPYKGCFTSIGNKKNEEICIKFDPIVIEPEDDTIVCSTHTISNANTTTVLEPLSNWSLQLVTSDFCEEVDVSNIECLQKISLDLKYFFRWTWPWNAPESYFIVLRVFDSPTKLPWDTIFTNTNTATGNVQTWPTTGLENTECFWQDWYLNWLDVSSYSTLYFNFDIFTNTYWGDGSRPTYIVNWGNNYTPWIKMFHSEQKYLCQCKTTDDRCFDRPRVNGNLYTIDTINVSNTDPVTPYWMVWPSDKNFIKKVKLYLDKSASVPNTIVTSNIYNSFGWTLIGTSSVTLFQGLAYTEACIEFDPLLNVSAYSSLYYEFIVTTPSQINSNQVTLYQANGWDFYINGVLQNGTPNGLTVPTGIYFDTECLDAIPWPEIFEIDEFCIDYQHKNRYV